MAFNFQLYKPRARGFTLIELLIVTVIIVILMALVSVILIRVVDRARITRTIGLVKLLSEACAEYKGVFNKPPIGATAANGGPDSSKSLHELLGKPLPVPMGHASGPGGPPPAVVTHPPFVLFKPEWLDGTGTVEPNPPRNVIDAWGRTIRYAVPGTYATNLGWDIWSRGADDSNDPKTWLGNWEHHTAQ
jgi:prepilin-type N-terminal cleavage/methylation domain-containing protein